MIINSTKRYLGRTKQEHHLWNSIYNPFMCKKYEYGKRHFQGFDTQRIPQFFSKCQASETTNI